MNKNELVSNEVSYYREQKLTRFDEAAGHYYLAPQRGCFERCANCYNLSEADSFEKLGKWYFKPECEWCVQRIIDLLGYSEHGRIADLQVSDTKKTRTTEGSFMQQFLEAAKCANNDYNSDEPLI